MQTGLRAPSVADDQQSAREMDSEKERMCVCESKRERERERERERGKTIAIKKSCSRRFKE